MLSDQWIDDILQRSKHISPEDPIEQKLCDLLVKGCFENYSNLSDKKGLLLAAAFDLLVAAQYYSAISHSGWLYSPGQEPKLFFHYTNCCPRSVLKNEFYFHPSQKPRSGKIGTITSKLLVIFLGSIFRYLGYEEDVLKGTEPVDLVIVNTKKHLILFAEIKAAPLLTPPIAAKSQNLTFEKEGEAIERGYSSVDNTNLFNMPLDILIPGKISEDEWKENYFPIGSRNSREDKNWGFRGLIKLIEESPDFFSEYFTFWTNAFIAYYPKKTSNIFWLTNACGTPSPTPLQWPSRKQAQGYESISDSKTSVGMDRTDDIKKGIYQVLKLGSQGKPNTRKWKYKVGLISNIHAARHFNEYLESFKDIVWTIDKTKRAKKVGDLPQEQSIYNLFDGIVALTSSFTRDEWIEKIFNFIIE
ncbi:MAG: hypothetical protein QNJ42_04875 [Crocosphaera sp.]|nr:hypothetical protein [Crocosphaera sp.]